MIEAQARMRAGGDIDDLHGIALASDAGPHDAGVSPTSCDARRRTAGSRNRRF